MNEYLFYTTEGQTEAPNENYEVENCQMLGRAKGCDATDALNRLLKENSWILEAGFNPTEFVITQLLTEEQRVDIKTIVDYLWPNEKQNYGSNRDKDNHIFNTLKRLKDL